MVSLALPKTADNDEGTMLAAPDTEKTSYGYGTELRLEEEQVTALGAEKVRIGQKVRIVAYGVVTSLSVDVGEEGEAPGPDMCVQLTDMEMTPASNVDATTPCTPARERK